MASLKLLSLNVLGFRNNAKRKSLFRQLKQNNYDIICLQESHATADVIEIWKKEWGGEIIYCEGTNKSKGQIILLKKNFPFEYTIQTLSSRIVSIKIKEHEKETCIFNVYAPNSATELSSFFLDLAELIVNTDTPRKIVCGDFNCVLNNELDVISGNPHHAQAVHKFNSFLDTTELTDIWRLFHPDRKEYSWSRRINNVLIARRLDYILATDMIIDDLLECSMYSFASSDHRGVAMELKCHDQTRGPGFWKFNNALLKDINFVDKINNVITEFLAEHTDTEADLKWELLKIQLKSEAIQYSKRIAIDKKNNKILLQSEFDQIDKSLARDPHNEDMIRNREAIRVKLEILEREAAKSAQTRARMKWIEEGEKNTKYFLNLEKSKANAKLFPKLEVDNKVLTNQFDILKAQNEHFSKLYSKPPTDKEEEMDNFFQTLEIPQISAEHKTECEGLINIVEATEALKSMKNGSSPGLDGLTTEFIKMFWLQLNVTIIESYNAAFRKGTLSYSQSSAVITLIHKGKNLPKSSLNNWRPISLTNTDYKLLAKCLAARLSYIIPTIINEDQSGYVKGRNIASAIRTIDDVIEYLRVKEKPGLLLALDFSKAFDTISKKFLIQAFQRFGFGDSFLQWIKTLLANTHSCINYNGWLSDSFELKCGVRQGCPFSPLAFIIGIEMLAIKFRQENQVKGIKVNSRDVTNTQVNTLKIQLYADDVTLMLNDENDIQHVFNILNDFGNISRLTININKSQAMWLGSNRDKTEEYLGLKWVNKIKILGVYFSNKISASLIEDNWQPRIDTVKQFIRNWEKRNLGLLGKICVIKTFLLSQFVYIMQSIALPEKILTEMNTLLFRFLWRKKDCNKKAFEKVKRNVVINNTENGGINMIDFKLFQQSCLCEWLLKLHTAPINSKWALIPRYYFGQLGRNLACFNSTIGSVKFKGLENIQSVFWKEVASTWLNNNKINTVSNPQTECLWNNPRITYQNNVIFFKEWASQGITYVHDILINNRILTFDEVKLYISESPSLYLQYLVVRSSLTAFLHQYPHYQHTIFSEPLDLLFNDCQMKKAKSFRLFLSDKKYTEPVCIRFWRNKMDTVIDKQYWALAQTCTKESRLKELQWKILHNIYPTNILLNKMGLVGNNKCSYCLLEVDYIEHFFIECKQIKPLWIKVSDIFHQKHYKRISLSDKNKLFGIIKSVELTSLEKKYLNHLILIAKMCISKYRYGTPINICIMFEQELTLRRLT